VSGPALDCRRFLRALAAVSTPAARPLPFDPAARAHLLACPACRAAFRTARGADTALRSLAEPAVEEGFFRELERAVLDRVAAEEQRPRLRQGRRLVAAAGLFVLFGLGLGLATLTVPSPRSRLLDSPSLENLEPFAFDPNDATFPVGESPFFGLRGRALLDALPDGAARREGGTRRVPQRPGSAPGLPR
jgi:hypothetical protein